MMKLLFKKINPSWSDLFIVVALKTEFEGTSWAEIQKSLELFLRRYTNSEECLLEEIDSQRIRVTLEVFGLIKNSEEYDEWSHTSYTVWRLTHKGKKIMQSLILGTSNPFPVS